jgi:hypothetical protein|tara:strand:+ start:434 stop:625 length:192 start_codon:yes stop_codon:yes gene_type:complete
MIDEDRTYENEVRFNNDRLVGRKNRQDSKVNISLVMESANAQKDEKEKIDEMDSTVSNMFTSQ